MAVSPALDSGELLRIFAPNGFGAQGRYLRFKDWLEAGSYVPTGLVGPASFTLTPHNSSDLVSALTGEFCSSALSAIESMIEVERGSRNARALAWPAIEAYYSSFFSAHSFMRFFGTGCTWLALADMGRLKKVAHLYNALDSTGPRKGQWKYCLLPNGDIAFELGGATGGGGAHDVVWEVFAGVVDDVLEKMSKSSIIAASDSNALTLLLSDLKKQCKTTSNIRNGINYRREYGVWFPYSGFDRRYESALRNSSGWRDGNCGGYVVATSAPGLTSLFNFSYIMVRVCLSLCRAGAKYFEGRGKVITNGPLKLCATQ